MSSPSFSLQSRPHARDSQLADKAAKAAVKTHKDRVAEFNDRLEKMSEHYVRRRGLAYTAIMPRRRAGHPQGASDSRRAEPS